MSNFPSYCVAGFLQEIGWPKSSGLIKKRITVPALVVDVTVEQMVRVAVGLGSGRPRDAARILADTFGNRDWSVQPAAQLIADLDSDVRSAIASHSSYAPWRTIASVINHPISVTGKEMIEWKELDRPETEAILSIECAQGLVWGLLNPDDVETALNADRDRYDRDAPGAIKHGLAISTAYTWPTNEDFYVTCGGSREKF